MAAPKATTPQGNGPDDKAAASADLTPISPQGLQPGETPAAPLTTNPPRGVDEAPADAIADEPAAAALQGHVQNVLDEETKRGFRGAKKANVVPNENYTLRGVGKGLPTPETTVHTPSSK